MTLARQVGGRIREMRLKCGFTQVELAHLLRVPFQIVQHHEHGRQINLDRLEDMAGIFVKRRPETRQQILNWLLTGF